jgi:hypothetical protein
MIEPTTMFSQSTQFECSDVRKLAFDAKDLLLQYRLTFAMVCLTVINIISHHVKSTFIKKFEAYQHLTPQASQELGIRCMQLLFGVYIAGTGYATLAFNLATGCNANEVFLCFLGGIWLIFFDIHEYVCRWPLAPTLLFHHVGVILFGLAVADWEIVPKPGQQLHWTIVMVISNIGATWISDFFHAVYRTSF